MHGALYYCIELLTTFTAGTALLDYSTRVKRGFAFVLVHNLNPPSGHVKGARYVLGNMSITFIYLGLVIGTRKEHRVCLPRNADDLLTSTPVCPTPQGWSSWLGPAVLALLTSPEDSPSVRDSD